MDILQLCNLESFTLLFYREDFIPKTGIFSINKTEASTKTTDAMGIKKSWVSSMPD